MLSDAYDSYLRHPTVHGDEVGFIAHDDVWIAPLGGGAARQLTGEHAPAKDLRFSPDGTRLAYVSYRDGHPELHVVRADGGESVRTTWWGDPGARVLGWADDAHVHVASAVGEPLRSSTWARSVPLDGGPATRLPHGPVTALDIAADGATVIGTGHGGRRRDYALWKRYRGGTAGRLWTDVSGSGDFVRVLGEVTAQLNAPMWVGGRLAYLSDDEGVGNVYSVHPDGTDLRRHTDHDDFYARHASTDGTRIVYAAGGELWLLEDLAADSRPRRLDIRTGGPRVTRHPVAAGKHLGEVAAGANASAVEVRGTVQWVTHSDGPVRALTPGSAARARMPRRLGEQVVWVDDASGEDGLVVADTDGRGQRSVAAGELGRVIDLAGTPDGQHIAVTTHDGRVLLVDAGTGEHAEIARTEDGSARDLVFSPDSAWLAWTHPGAHERTQIMLAEVAPRAVHEASTLRFADHHPVFTLDGRYLAFLSTRTFDPVYDEQVFDLGFPSGTRPQLLPLSADTPVPFRPASEGRSTVAPVEVLDVDTDGLAERAVALPTVAAKYSRLLAVAGGLAWLRLEPHGVLGDARSGPEAAEPRPRLERMDLATAVIIELATGIDDAWAGGAGTRIVVRDREKLRVLPADTKASSDAKRGDPAAAVEVDLGGIRVEVDPGVEWLQMYDEAGRLMRDHFWVADMAGNDWATQLARYRPLIARAGTRDDVSDLLWEVQAELGTSHAYETPPDRDVASARRLGHLGADLARDPDGTWRITRVLPGEPSAATGRSPLLAAGVGDVVGSALLAVDGRAVDPVTGPAPLLVGTASKPVELRLRGGDGERSVVVVPVAQEMPLRYFDWVAGRRAAVHAATDGRVGYLHVPDMMGGGWAQLHRDLATEIGRDALLLDVRSNGGGHTSQLVVEILARRLTGWSVPRNKQPETYPHNTRRGPMVTITDENAGSDGDIVTAMIQERDLGPVVGMRSWGGVVGIDSEFSLVDGTVVTQPRYATWIVNRGWSVENHGTDPDVEVPRPPQSWAAGTDPQLDAALEVVAAELTAHPPAVAPTTEDRPSRATPPLGPRP